MLWITKTRDDFRGEHILAFENHTQDHLLRTQALEAPAPHQLVHAAVVLARAVELVERQLVVASLVLRERRVGGEQGRRLHHHKVQLDVEEARVVAGLVHRLGSAQILRQHQRPVDTGRQQEGLLFPLVLLSVLDQVQLVAQGWSKSGLDPGFRVFSPFTYEMFVWKTFEE